MNSESQVFAVIDTFFIYACLPLLTTINISISNLQIYGNVRSVLFPWLFADFHFLYFVVLKMRFLHIAPLVYWKYMLKISGVRRFIRVAISYGKIYLPGWLVQTCKLETSGFTVYCTVQTEFWITVSIFWFCVFAV